MWPDELSTYFHSLPPAEKKIGRFERFMKNNLPFRPEEKVSLEDLLDNKIGVENDFERGLITFHQYTGDRAHFDAPLLRNDYSHFLHDLGTLAGQAFFMAFYHGANTVLTVVGQGNAAPKLSSDLSKLTKVPPRLAEFMNSVGYTAYNIAFYQKIINPSIEISDEWNLLAKGAVYATAGFLVANKAVGTSWNLYRISRRLLRPEAEVLPAISAESALVNNVTIRAYIKDKLGGYKKEAASQDSNEVNV